MKKIIRLLTVFALFISVASAQGLEDAMKNLGQEAGGKFVQPIVTGFGADLNGGWFHKAPQSKIWGIDFELGFVVMGAFTTDEDKTLNASSAFKFQGGPLAPQSSSTKSEAQRVAENINIFWNPLLTDGDRQSIIDEIANTQFQVTITGPTVVGSKSDTMKVVIPQQTITVGGVPYTIDQNTRTINEVTGVLDGKATIPLFAPQLSIGTLYGTQATFRFLPEINASDEIGKIKYFGFGIQHNLGMWLPIPVVDVSASFFTQKLNVGTIMEAKTTSFGLNASKKFGFDFLNVTPYAGFMIESAKMTFSYDFPTYTDPDNPVNNKTERISFEMEGANKTRLTIGLSIRLAIININADYNLGKQNSATAGVFFAF